MQNMKDPYRILNVPKNATQDEIRAAFRKVAKDTHPDANVGSNQSMDRYYEATEAYAILSNPTRRNNYDSMHTSHTFKNSNSSQSSNTSKTKYQRNNKIPYYESYYYKSLKSKIDEEVKPLKRQALKALLSGLAWLLGGLLVTFVAYYMAVTSPIINYFIVYWGLILYGGIRAVNAFIQFYKITKTIHGLKKEIRDQFV